MTGTFKSYGFTHSSILFSYRPTLLPSSNAIYRDATACYTSTRTNASYNQCALKSRLERRVHSLLGHQILEKTKVLLYCLNPPVLMFWDKPLFHSATSCYQWERRRKRNRLQKSQPMVTQVLHSNKINALSLLHWPTNIRSLKYDFRFIAS